MNSNPTDRFPSHFKEFIPALNANQVEYMLIGGYAVGAYGHVRGTNDLDIFIHATPENAERMERACIQYGINGEDISREMFLVDRMIGIGDPPLRIELLKKLNFVDFKYAFRRVTKRNVDGIDINVVDLDDLILLKRAAVKGRSSARDSEDLSFLERLKAKLTGMRS